MPPPRVCTGSKRPFVIYDYETFVNLFGYYQRNEYLPDND